MAALPFPLLAWSMPFGDTRRVKEERTGVGGAKTEREGQEAGSLWSLEGVGTGPSGRQSYGEVGWATGSR